MKLPSPPPIYFDYHATTPVDPRVAEVVLDTMTSCFGNANSVEHLYGEAAAELVAQARCDVAELLACEPSAVHFTAGASESIRLALKHEVTRPRSAVLRVAVSTVEHRAVLDPIDDLEREGKIVRRWLPVDHRARLDLSEVERVCDEGIDLICVQAANNEVGTVYPVGEVAKLARAAGARLLVDATQAAGRVKQRVDDWNLAYVAISGHKIYGPKGVGALIAPDATNLRPERGSTPGTGDGTPNVPGIVGLGEAARLRHLEMVTDEDRIAQRRDKLEALLLAGIDDLLVNGDRQCRLSGNLHIAIPYVPNDIVLSRLRRHVAVSTGAACSSGAQEDSHVLRAMGLPDAIRQGALRIGIGKFTTDSEIESGARHIIEAVVQTRAFM